jgi:hypothetical protein
MGIVQPPVPMVQLVLVLSFTLLACKLGKSEDDPERPLPVVDGSAPAPQPATPPPAPQPAAPVPAAPAPAAPAPAPAAPAPAAPTPAAPAKAATATATTGGASTATTGAVAGTTSTTGAAGTTGGIAVPSAACINKCGNAMRKCLADAKFGDDVATKCQGAFASCQKDCQ